MGIRLGDVAPDFTLPRDGGGTISLSAFRGRPIVLFFYPKDDTQACTLEAISFSELADEFAAAGITLTCGAGNLVTTGLPSTGTSVTVSTAGVPAGTLCTGTVLAANVTDTDAGDPPDNMLANFTWTFTTDFAPSVSTVTPPNGATNVATNTSLTVNFSENVDVTAGGCLTMGALPGRLAGALLTDQMGRDRQSLGVGHLEGRDLLQVLERFAPRAAGECGAP